jgi:glycosyltransferase involved in cell wall biosynthesis
LNQTLTKRASIDNTPWAHPFLTPDRIARFRSYSDTIQAAALAHRQRHPRRLDAAFAVNMAQSMYKWARLADKYGADATLYLHPQDRTAISRPEWEEFDGEFDDVLDGARFLAHHHATINLHIVEAPNDDDGLGRAVWEGRTLPSWKAWSKRTLSLRAPNLALRLQRHSDLARLRLRAPTVRFEPLLDLDGMYPYFRWAELLSHHEVIYAASAPFPAYVSGKPYCTFSVGGDLQFDAGRTDDYGEATRRAFASARFILVSNPHTLGHCRRLGFSNAVYLPYPMDTDRYSPAPGHARREWIERFGGNVFVLTTSRIDQAVKGHSEDWFAMIGAVAQVRPDVRFLFLGWGAQADEFRVRIATLGLSQQVIVLPPVGKKRLIDYYRSSDVVLDQFVYGYYGATALEAAATARPVIMKLRTEHYAPLYRGDVAPVLNASTPDAVRGHLLELIDSETRRTEVGSRLREWIVRTHGEQTTAPLMLALLQLAADGQAVNQSADNPLHDPLSPDEREYHRQCLQ